MIMLLIGAGGCQVHEKNEASQLSSEYKRLCESKRTKNQSLCQLTMGQLTKFGQDVNTYFETKFNINDFQLTSIHFPYHSFEHSGFHATFHRKSDQSLMITATFDYRDGTYQIRNEANENTNKSGQMQLASAIVLSEFYKTMPISTIEDELEKIGLSTDKTRNINYYFDSGRFFNKRNIIVSRESFIVLTEEEQEQVIKDYKENKTIQIQKYYDKLRKTTRFFGFTYAKNKEEIQDIFKKYMSYRKEHPEYNDILEPRIYYYENATDVIEKDISMYINNEVEIHDE